MWQVCCLDLADLVALSALFVRLVRLAQPSRLVQFVPPALPAPLRRFGLPDHYVQHVARGLSLVEVVLQTW